MINNIYNLTALTAATGDQSKPLLVAICLIVSVVLSVILLITGRMVNKKDEADDSDDE